MTNHEKFVQAFRNARGQKLSTNEIRKRLRQAFPDQTTTEKETRAPVGARAQTTEFSTELNVAATK
jgi:hypothetical protein